MIWVPPSPPQVCTLSTDFEKPTHRSPPTTWSGSREGGHVVREGGLERGRPEIRGIDCSSFVRCTRRGGGGQDGMWHIRVWSSLSVMWASCCSNLALGRFLQFQLKTLETPRTSLATTKENQNTKGKEVQGSSWFTFIQSKDQGLHPKDFAQLSYSPCG